MKPVKLFYRQTSWNASGGRLSHLWKHNIKTEFKKNSLWGYELTLIGSGRNSGIGSFRKVCFINVTVVCTCSVYIREKWGTCSAVVCHWL